MVIQEYRKYNDKGELSVLLGLHKSSRQYYVKYFIYDPLSHFQTYTYDEYVKARNIFQQILNEELIK